MHRFTIVLGATFLLGGLVALVLGHFPPGWIFLCEGAFVIAAVVFERYRYKPIVAVAPRGKWVKTSERFIDQQTGKPVTVYLDPESGERQYVSE